MPLGSTTPIKNRSSIQNKIRRRQTIDTVQGRQHRTALQQLQSMFWSSREAHNIINNNQLNEHEQLPMVTKKRSSNVQRSSSVRDNNQTTINENLNE
jgi:hypothetical protein